MVGPRHRAGGMTPWEYGTGPAVSSVTQASRLVAQIAPSVAFELGLRILAAGPAPPRLYSD